MGYGYGLRNPCLSISEIKSSTAVKKKSSPIHQVGSLKYLHCHLSAGATAVANLSCWEQVQRAEATEQSASFREKVTISPKCYFSSDFV